MRYALIEDSVISALRDFGVTPDPNPGKGLDWRPCPRATVPSYDAATEVLEGPSYEIGAETVTESYSVRSKTAQEISAEKDSAVASVNGAYDVLMEALTLLENDNRAIKAKINESVPGAFPAGQTQAVTVEQVRTFIRNNL